MFIVNYNFFVPKKHFELFEQFFPTFQMMMSSLTLMPLLVTALLGLGSVWAEARDGQSDNI